MILHLSEGSDNKPNILKKNILLKDSREFLVQIQTEKTAPYVHVQFSKMLLYGI